MVTNVLHPVVHMATFKVGYVFMLQKLHKLFLDHF